MAKKQAVRLHNELVSLVDTLDAICEVLVQAKVLVVDAPQAGPRKDLPHNLPLLAREANKTAMHILNRLRRR